MSTRARLAGALALAMCLLLPAASVAHPGVGIVIDSRGNVFFTDLKQVWQIAPGGAKSIAVPNVHTHELCIDAGDNLYGEHLWYEGEATDRWGHRIWRRTPDGKVTDVIPARRGFRDDYDYFSFVRDGAGTMYWVDRRVNQVKKRVPGGTVVTMSQARFPEAGWMTVTPGGRVFLGAGRDLHEVAPDGSPRVVARSIAERGLLQVFVGDRHLVMGLWTDPAGNLFAAVYGARVVKRISPAGQVSEFARSSPPWSPTGGIVAGDGSTWLLEYSVTGAARVRRLARDGSSRVY